MSLKISRQNLIILVAVMAGLLALGIYIWSGQASLESSTRELKNADKNIEQVTVQEETEGQKTVKVSCKDGSEYDVYYPPGENNYEALAASKCQE